MRGTYDSLMARPAQIEEILRAGAAQARQLSQPLMAQLRQAVGLRDLSAVAQQVAHAAPKHAAPSIKQYREADGRFFVKLIDADGTTLLQSLGLDSPRESGAPLPAIEQALARLLSLSQSA
jgi:tryptophanyl-tRNA synthetase